MSAKVGLFKKMMIEIPHVPVFTVHMLVGIGIAAVYLKFFHVRDQVGYMAGYTVMRPDDPRLSNMKKFPYDP